MFLELVFLISHEYLKYQDERILICFLNPPLLTPTQKKRICYANKRLFKADAQLKRAVQE